MKTRELVKSGKLSVGDALSRFAAIAKSGEPVGDSIIGWLERRIGKRAARPSSQQPKRSKR